MREPQHAATVIGAMAKAVKIPVTVKMRAGWNDKARNAPELARMVQDAGAAAVTIHGRTAEQSYSGTADWELVAEVARQMMIPVLGSGDCVEPEQVVERMQSGVSGVLVGRGVLRNPWILSQASDLAAGRPPRPVTLQERGEFLCNYVEMLLNERVGEGDGFRHLAPGMKDAAAPARGRERWVINKVRALCAWYSKGLEGGSQLRTRVNTAATLGQLRAIVDEFFFGAAVAPS
jgi:tRNA-dihydrouridine synthase